MPRGAGLGPGACRLWGAWHRGGLEALAREPAVRAHGEKAWREVLRSPGGLAWLVDLRAEVLGAGSTFRAAHPDLEPGLRAELRGALLPGTGAGSDAGSLRGGLAAKVLREDAPDAVLQRAVDAERVHSMASTRELLPRLTDPFRGFALEHPELDGRPLAFLYTRLFPGRGDLGQTLARVMPPASSLQSPAGQLEDPAAARSAVFYSVSTAEPGLQGLGLAGLLIKRAAEALSASSRGRAFLHSFNPFSTSATRAGRKLFASPTMAWPLDPLTRAQHPNSLHQVRDNSPRNLTSSRLK